MGNSTKPNPTNIQVLWVLRKRSILSHLLFCYIAHRYLGSGKPNEDKYLIRLFGRINSVIKNDIIPHQPRKNVVVVNCQKYFLMQALHKFPFTDFCSLKTSKPMFWYNATYFVGDSHKQFSQNDRYTLPAVRGSWTPDVICCIPPYRATPQLWQNLNPELTRVLQ